MRRVDTFVVTALGRGSGTPLWHHDVPAEPGVPRPALGTLVRAGPDQVLVAVPGAAGGPVILALDPDTGATQATLPVPGLTDPSWVIADDSVIAYLAATDLTSPQPVADIVVRDRATLALRWSSVPPPDIQSLPSPTLISQGRLYAQSLAGGRPSIVAYALDGCGAAVCDPLFTVPVPQPSTTNPSHSASLLAATDDGHLLVRLDTGPGTNRLLGIGVTEGTLFSSQTGAGISAYAPT
jgi:outer membrane protein assembly factor BamB